MSGVSRTGKVPSAFTLGYRGQRDRESLKVITDGAGGFIDLRPEPGTVQEKVNHYFAGARVRWTVTLARPPVEGIFSTLNITSRPI